VEKRELPEGWEWKKIGDVAELIMGQSPPGSTYNESGDGIPFLQGNAEFGDFFPTHKKFTSHPSKIARRGSILISVRAPVGDINIANFDYCIGRGLASISLKNGENKYLFYLLKSLKPLIESKGTGSTFKAISKAIINEIEIPIPPLPVQRRIVEILEHADALRHLRAQVDAETQKLLQSVFYEMFGDPVRNEKGWKLQKLEDICIKIFGGGTPSTSNEDYFKGNIPWVSPKDMKDDFIFDSIDHISEKALNESSTQIAPDYSLLMVIRSGILKRKLPVAINVNPVAINQDMKAFIFKEDIVEPYYMLFFFKLYQNVLLKRVRSVTADNIEFNHIKTINVPLPPLNLQKQFSSFVNVIEIIKKQQTKSRNDIETLFDGLLDEVFKGNLSRQINKSFSQ